jgi:Fe-S-cluster containining protein
MKVKNCFECDGRCCRYLYIPLADPDDHIDFEQLIYCLSHEHVSIVIDDKKHMWLKLDTPCKYQDPGTNLCTQYHNRPYTCRKYQIKNCEKKSSGKLKSRR